MSHNHKVFLGTYMRCMTQVAAYGRGLCSDTINCNSPSSWSQERYVFLTFYLTYGTKRAEFFLKTDCFQAISLSINPYNLTEA